MSGMRRLAVIALVGCLCGPAVARADDALVLPRGRSAVSAENLFYVPTGERFNPHGNPEDIAAGFNDRRLDSSVFPLLQPLDPFVGGRASIGDSHLRFKYEFDILNFGFAYGVTDRLTVGVEIPYYWVHNSVKASVNSDPGSSANVGLRTGPGPGPLCGSGSAVLPLACPNTRRFTTEDVQRILGPGLPGIPGFGFKRSGTSPTMVSATSSSGPSISTGAPATCAWRPPPASGFRPAARTIPTTSWTSRGARAPTACLRGSTTITSSATCGRRRRHPRATASRAPGT